MAARDRLHRLGRFADRELERAYLALAWQGARLQSALTIVGLSLGTRVDTAA